MSLPATMKVLGLAPGIAMIIFMAFLTEASIEMLLKFSRAGKTSSYGGVMNYAFGNYGRTLLQVCVLINNIGVLVVFMIIIGDVRSGTSSSGTHHAGVLEGWFGVHRWNGRTIVLLVTTFAVFAPLASLKHIDSLRYTSALSVALAVVFLVVTAGITVFKLMSGSITMPRLLPDATDFTSVFKLFTAVPVLVTAYICHYNENELEDRTKIRAVVRSSLALCSTIYVMTSLFGFLLFGDATLDDVLANFDTNLGIPYSSLLNDAVRVSYAAHLMLVFPIVFFPLRLNLDGLLFPSTRPLVSDNNICGLYRSALGLLVLSSWGQISYLAFGMLSSLLEQLLQFVEGSFFLLLLLWGKLPSQLLESTRRVVVGDRHGIATKKDKILCIFMIVLAVFSNLVAIYSDAYALFKKNASPHE